MMAGIWTIARKELKDHVSDQTFLLCFTILLVVMVAETFYFVHYIKDWNFRMSARITASLLEEGAGWKFWYIYITEWITSKLSTIGVLVSVALSFNSINKERSEGNLKVLLSYPIYRDKVILGKIIAGLIVVSLVTVSVMTISFSILTFYLSIPITTDFLLRVATVTFMGIMLLAFYLCAGMAVSTVFRDTSTILVSLVLISSLLRFQSYNVLVVVPTLNLLSILGLHFSRAGLFRQGVRYKWINPYYRTYCRLSPTESYLKLSERLFNFGKGYESTPYSRGEFIPFADHLSQHLDLVAVQIFYVVAAFLICYVLFTRREIT